MKLYVKHIVVLFFAFAMHPALFAQQVNVAANIDSNSIKIGEQVKIHLVVTYKGGPIKIQWPAISDSLISKIKVISKSKVDTVKTDSLHRSLQQMKQDLLITSFDSGYYAIPPFTFIVNGDTAHPQQTEPIMLYVKTVSVDTTKAFKDIKAPYSAPWSILEILPYIGYGAAGLVVLIIIIYFVVKALKKDKPEPVVVKAPPVDPHIKALTALEQLVAKKLWQEGKIKDYHTGITDVLRIYLEDRFGINAQEMITDEIMQSLRRTDIDGELKNKLKQILVLADLVKFAKEQPLPAEHEGSYNSAVDFIKGTIKQVPASVQPAPQTSQQP